MADGAKGKPTLFVSSDGIRWIYMHQLSFRCIDGCNFFYNPFRDVFSWSMREQTPGLMRRVGSCTRLPCLVQSLILNCPKICTQCVHIAQCANPLDRP